MEDINEVNILIRASGVYLYSGSTDQEVKNVVYDSRKVEEGSLFICIRGAVVDGHKFVAGCDRKRCESSGSGGES